MGIKHNPYFTLSLLYLCFSLINHASFGADTISGNQSLSGDQTIVSSGGNFVLGFFKPGNSSNFYIGMWYNKVPLQTIVWVANKETPISDKHSSELKILNGNLVLLNESKIQVWSTNIINSITSNNSLVATLRDDGNFVLEDGSSSTQQPIWQSFDFPTHTWLPGSKIGFNKHTNKSQLLTSWKNSEDPSPGLFSLELDPNGSQYLIRWNGSQYYWSSGSWNGRIFSDVPEMRLNYIYNFSYISNENESYFTYSLYDPSTISRFFMDVSGQIKQLSWLDNGGSWNLFWSQPRQQCEVYAYCGVFGACNQITQPFCNCLHGFIPKSAKDWNLSDFSGGCVRNISLPCAVGSKKRDRFWEQPHMGLPQADDNPSLQYSYWDCESTCLSRCDCIAYANGTYANGSSKCSIWYGKLLNVKQLAKDDGTGLTGETVYIRIAASESSNPKNKKTVIIGSVIGSVAGSVALIGLVIFWRWKNKQQGTNKSFKNRFMLSSRHENSPNNDVTQGGSSDVPFFHLKIIIAATDGFFVANKLGQGGFGPVYKGNLPNGQKIAVKRLSNNSGQGMREFKNEVILISKLQHRNLVKLLGFCVEGDEKLLIYEYMPNKSLDAFLSGSSERGILEWDQRYNIIEGIARGLLYLHRDSRLKVIHRDLKPSNILLDEDMNPKISDFGMAKMFGGNQTLANTNRIVGTYGYMSPEYAMQGLFSEKSDVFSFGVLLLEIVSNKKNTSFYHHENHLNLLGYAWQLWNEGKALELLDPRLSNSKSPSQVMRCIHVGLLCVQEHAKDRPTMSTIIFMLCNEATLPTPKQPAFILDRDSTESNSPLLNNITCSTNCVSITTIGGR